MSLLVTPLLVQLYNKVLIPTAFNDHAKTFRIHLLRTEFFTSGNLVIATGSPPNPFVKLSLRQVDTHISIMDTHLRLQVVVICAIRVANASTKEIE